MSELSKEEQIAWDILNTPSIESHEQKLTRLIAQTAAKHIGGLNDVYTRNTIVNEINQVLEDLVYLEGIEDFKVICDESNNTPSSINNNVLQIDTLVKAKRHQRVMEISVSIS